MEASQQANDQEKPSSDEKSKVIVPLPYKATRHSSKILIDNKNHLTTDARLKSIILHKAAAAYFCLVDRNEKEKNYGSCLRYLRLALNCYSKNVLFFFFQKQDFLFYTGAELKYQSMDHSNSSAESKKLLSYIMSIAGDCRLMIAHVTSAEEIEKYREQYQVMSDVDLEVQKVIDEIGIDRNSSGKDNIPFFILTP